MSKFKYILVILALLSSTALVVFIPEFVEAHKASLLSKSYLYIDTNVVENKEITSTQVVEVISKGKLIYGYTNENLTVPEDLNKLKTESKEVLNSFFAHDTNLRETILKEVSDSEIVYHERMNCYAVIDDRLVVLDLISVNYSSDVGITYEENTSTIIDFYRKFSCQSEEEGLTVLKDIDYCAAKYYSSLEENSVSYNMYSEIYDDYAYLSIGIEPNFDDVEKEIQN